MLVATSRAGRGTDGVATTGALESAVSCGGASRQAESTSVVSAPIAARYRCIDAEWSRWVRLIALATAREACRAGSPDAISPHLCESLAAAVESVQQWQQHRGDAPDAGDERGDPDQPAACERRDGAERDGDLEEGDGGGEVVMLSEEPVRVARPLVPLAFELTCLALDLGLLLCVAG